MIRQLLVLTRACFSFSLDEGMSLIQMNLESLPKGPDAQDAGGGRNKTPPWTKRWQDAQDAGGGRNDQFAKDMRSHHSSGLGNKSLYEVDARGGRNDQFAKDARFHHSPGLGNKSLYEVDARGGRNDQFAKDMRSHHSSGLGNKSLYEVDANARGGRNDQFAKDVRFHHSPGLGNNSRYQAHWVEKFGANFMDAIIFPDPAAGKEVYDAVKRWGIRSPQVMIVGFKESGSSLHCRVEVGSSHQDSPIKLYPSASEAERPEYSGDKMLTCSISEEALQKLGQVDNQLLVGIPDPQGLLQEASHLDQVPVRLGWGNGLNETTMLPSRRYKVAITCMMKNVGQHIVEWLEWHIAQGVEHFFIYDNLSEEADLEHTLPYERAGIVTRVLWPYCCQGKGNNVGQRGQMNHALYKFGQVADWIISLDPDEFIVTGGRSIPALLDQISPGTHVVGMNSFLMQACEHGSQPGPHQMGPIGISKGCQPLTTTMTYPGKMFVRSLGAYDVGLVLKTPHPNQFKASYKVITSNMTIAHFRKKAQNNPHIAPPGAEQLPAEQFAADFKRISGRLLK